MADIKNYSVTSDVEGGYLVYKGLPLVREGNRICYGNTADKYIVQIMIFSDDGSPNSIMVQLLKTDNSLADYDRIVNQVFENDLFSALATGSTWLERSNAQKK